MTFEQDENEQIAQRRAKLALLREQGQAFPNDFCRDAFAGDLLQVYGEQTAEILEKNPHAVQIAGRLMTRRIMGKAAFVHLQDMSGKIQVYLKRDELPADVYEIFKSWDIGDILGITGTLFKTKTGELSVKASQARLLTKALRPLPEKFHGLADQETRYRQRYLDLIMSEDTRRTFKIRSGIIQGIRHYLTTKGFLEVETPMMHPIPGGATARPFVTFHNALDMELFLRIAPELYLKRLVVGGIERVFEINRNFRNEGLSTRHNPEFTMLEFYQAYGNYQDLMNLTEEMLGTVTQQVLGTKQFIFQEINYDFTKPFNRFTMKEAILHFNPELPPAMLESLAAAQQVANQLAIPLKSDYGLGKVQTEIFEKTVEPNLQEPTFITAYPTEVSPLARRNDHDPLVTDRFELFIAGREIANGFSELNDPEDQAERFHAQIRAKEAGDLEAMHFDSDYIMALEHGMPPTAGEGIGIDRLVMLLTDSPSIRDVLLFPHLRPRAK